MRKGSHPTERLGGRAQLGRRHRHLTGPVDRAATSATISCCTTRRFKRRVGRVPVVEHPLLLFCLLLTVTVAALDSPL